MGEVVEYSTKAMCATLFRHPAQEFPGRGENSGVPEPARVPGHPRAVHRPWSNAMTDVEPGRRDHRARCRAPWFNARMRRSFRAGGVHAQRGVVRGVGMDVSHHATTIAPCPSSRAPLLLRNRRLNAPARRVAAIVKRFNHPNASPESAIQSMVASVPTVLRGPYERRRPGVNRPWRKSFESAGTTPEWPNTPGFALPGHCGRTPSRTLDQSTCAVRLHDTGPSNIRHEGAVRHGSTRPNRWSYGNVHSGLRSFCPAAATKSACLHT